MDCQPVASDGDGPLEPVASDGDGEDEAPGEIWESCEEIPLTRSSCTGEVCSDVPVTGSQCDGLDLENCKNVPVKELKCRQVSSIECQALWDRGGDCHYAGVGSVWYREVEGDKMVSEGDKMVLEGDKIVAEEDK